MATNKIMVRLPDGLRERLDETRGDVSLNTAVVRAIEDYVATDAGSAPGEPDARARSTAVSAGDLAGPARPDPKGSR